MLSGFYLFYRRALCNILLNLDRLEYAAEYEEAKESKNCSGYRACYGLNKNDIDIPCGSCNGEFSCEDSIGEIGEGSCVGDYACTSAEGELKLNHVTFPPNSKLLPRPPCIFLVHSNWRWQLLAERSRTTRADPTLVVMTNVLMIYSHDNLDYQCIYDTRSNLISIKK
eukprot:scaffold90326_cov24-Cyclotella_meneghiniana.AAC.2